MSWVASGQPLVEAHKFFHYLDVLPAELRREGYVAMFIGQLAGVHYFEPALSKEKKLVDVVVFDKRLSDVINLPPKILCVTVREKCNGRERDWPWNNINQLADWVSPDGMEFTLDKYTRPFPDCPTDNLLAAKLGNVFWKDCETFVQWLVAERLTSNGYGLLARNKALAELHNMGCAYLGGDHRMATSNDLFHPRPAAGA
jgi:hypothetical protein